MKVDLAVDMLEDLAGQAVAIRQDEDRGADQRVGRGQAERGASQRQKPKRGT